MRLSTLQYTRRYSRHAAGFASLLMVTSVGIALLILLISMYENTLQAHAVQKNSLLKNDYQQREDAFLRALINIIPNKAILCMQDNSMDASIQESLKWQSIINEALVLSNSRQALSADVASLLGVDNARSGNNTDSNLEQSAIINALNAEAAAPGAITSGTNLSATGEYPPPLECSATAHLDDALYPIVSLEKKYGLSAEGWVYADDPVSDFPLYNLIDAPELHFNYQNGDTIIAKHNWWAFEMSFASQDASMTRVITRKKKYLVSLYEIPSQLPISASAFTTFGTHSDGTEWANVSLQGSIFAEKVKTEGTFSTDAIAARKGVELSSATIISGSLTGSETGANPFASNARELSETAGNVFPISSSSDGGRVCFVPINRGLDFYDRWTGDPDQESASSNAVSPTSWDYYSIGAKQCAMHLDVIDVDEDQVPMAIRFSYWKDAGDDSVEGNLERVFVTFSINPEGTEQLWPQDHDDPGFDTFPFLKGTSYSSGRRYIEIHGERLANWLINDNAAPLDINHSIAVNVDHVNNVEIPKPSFPSEDRDLAVMLVDASDLTAYTSGFSMVTNMRLIFADDVNITPTSPPSGIVLPEGEDFYPPVSFFAPEKRYGDSGIALKIDIDGQLGSLARDNLDPVRIADLKTGYADQIVPENITANLKTINHPAALPPVNMMNWMVVIREIHPKYNPSN